MENEKIKNEKNQTNQTIKKMKHQGFLLLMQTGAFGAAELSALPIVCVCVPFGMRGSSRACVITPV